MRIAVIGSGISGLVTAYYLAERHRVTLFEADARLGGHTNTIELEQDGRSLALDTGFLVYNERTYPHFTQLLAELKVVTQPSEMSFSVRSDRNGWEYCGSSLSGLFADRRHFVRPRFYRMLADILRFHREAFALLAAAEPVDDEISLGEFIARQTYGREFAENYLLPMGAAIWSAPPREILRFPLTHLLRFMANHGLLSLRDRPTWRTVSGGAARYIDAMLRKRPFEVRLRSPVRCVRCDDRQVRVEVPHEQAESFDRVIIATHANQALSMLAEATSCEREVLGSFTFQRNEALLHTDTSLLPQQRRAWSSWNYHVPVDRAAPATVTYWLNRLQRLDSKQDFCVTLNDEARVNPASVLRRISYEHPVMNATSLAAQRRWHEISGANRVHYCGAYWGYGFHEDGVRSALAVVEQIESAAKPCTVASTKDTCDTVALGR